MAKFVNEIYRELNKVSKPGVIRAPRYGQKHVEILVSDSWLKFLKLHKQKTYWNGLMKGMKNATAATMNEVKSKMVSMDTVYSGFMRANMVAWIDTSKYKSGKELYSYIGTRAWYDVIVHEGYGIHGRPKNEIPSKYLPSEYELSIAPKWEDSRRLGKHKGSGRGPRPFMTQGIISAKQKIFGELSKGVVTGIKDTVSSGSMVARRKVASLFPL